MAESVADAFIQRGPLILHERALEEAIARAMAGDDEPVTDRRILDKFVEQLSHLGYIWQLEGADHEPGIPSLMPCIQEYSQT